MEKRIINENTKEQLKKKHAELRARMKKYDEELIKLINDKTKETIINVIREYLSQYES